MMTLCGSAIGDFFQVTLISEILRASRDATFTLPLVARWSRPRLGVQVTARSFSASGFRPRAVWTIGLWRVDPDWPWASGEALPRCVCV